MGKATVKRISCGIMFNTSFSLLDDWGKIADNLLYNKNGYFSPDYFPNISNQYTTSRFLQNPEAGHSLELSANNLIYTHVVQKEFSIEYEDYIKRIKNYLVPKIIEKYELITRRIGIVFFCEMDDKEIANFKKKYFISSADEITDCRFAIRSSTKEGLLFAGTDNYINKIYTVGNIDPSIRGISFDYQLYFQPALPSLAIKTSSFFEFAHKAFFDEILREEFCVS